MTSQGRPNLLTVVVFTSFSLAWMEPSAAVEKKIPFHTLSTSGATAECRFHVLNSRASMLCNLTDTEDDGHNPFVQWKIDAYDYRPKKYNKGGANTTETVKDNTSGQGHISTISWKVCRDEGTFGKDDCSQTQEYNVP